jgi:hypothetical protein
MVLVYEKVLMETHETGGGHNVLFYEKVLMEAHKIGRGFPPWSCTSLDPP